MQLGFARHDQIGRRLFEHTSLAGEKAERAVYKSSYKRFHKMGLDALDKKIDNKFRVDIFDPEAALSDNPEVIPTEDLEASHNMPQRALKRAYGQHIIKRIEHHDRVSDKQRAFLVKDFIENNGASSIANLFLKMHGFRSWQSLFDQAGVTQEEVQGHYGFDESGNPVIGFGDVDINDSIEKTFLQKHGNNLVKGVILTGATVATGGAGFLAAAGGLVGGAIGRRVTRYFSHDRFVKGKHKEKHHNGGHHGKQKGEPEDLSQLSRGMEMVTSIIDDYVAVRDEIITKMLENREARLAQQTEETAGTRREHFAFPKEVMDLEEGKNLLGLIMKGFAEKARENIGKNDKVGQYWAHEKISKRWELLGGLIGGVIGGGAGAALNAKLEAHRLMEAIHNGQGAYLDLDGDKIEHMVRSMYNPASGQMDFMWQMGSQDIARIGQDSVSGWTHTFVPGGVIVQGGTFDAAALQSLSPDQITVHATALNIPESVLMEKLFMSALMNNAETIGSITAAAVMLDNVHYKLTGMETGKNRKIAAKAVGRFAEFANQRRRAKRQQKLDTNLTPKTEEEFTKQREQKEKEAIRSRFQNRYVETNPAFKDAWGKVTNWEARKEHPTVFLDVSTQPGSLGTPAAVDHYATLIKTKFDHYHVSPGGGTRPAQIVLCMVDPEKLVVAGNNNLDTPEKVLTYIKGQLATSYSETAFDQLVILKKGLDDSAPSVESMAKEMGEVLADLGVDEAQRKIFTEII